MAWIGSGIIVLLVAGDAFSGDIGIITGGMATIAFNECMAFGQWKESIVHREFGRFPARQGRVAFQAFGGDPCGQVVGIGGGVKIRLMAGEAFG